MFSPPRIRSRLEAEHLLNGSRKINDIAFVLGTCKLDHNY